MNTQQANNVQPTTNNKHLTGRNIKVHYSSYERSVGRKASGCIATLRKTTNSPLEDISRPDFDGDAARHSLSVCRLVRFILFRLCVFFSLLFRVRFLFCCSTFSAPSPFDLPLGHLEEQVRCEQRSCWNRLNAFRSFWSPTRIARRFCLVAKNVALASANGMVSEVRVPSSMNSMQNINALPT